MFTLDKPDKFSHSACLTILLLLFHPASMASWAAGWGNNEWGQLGYNNSPVVPGAVLNSGALANKSIVQVTAGEAHTCALNTDGTVYCWGLNHEGELGNGNTTDSSEPVAVLANGALAGRSILLLSAGRYHTCAVTTDGGAYCWGQNTSGQLGNGNTNSSSEPVAVYADGVLSGKAIVHIEAGDYHTCAVTSDGKAYCWGMNQYGQLGTGNLVSSTEPLQVLNNGALAGKYVIKVAAGTAYTCAITTDGRAYCWGYNQSGQLGTGNTINYKKPTAVRSDWDGKPVAQITAGYQHTCAVTTDGIAYCSMPLS